MTVRPRAVPDAAPSRHSTLRCALVGAVALALLSACSPRVDNRGTMIDSELLSEVRPGMSSRDDVLYLLGTPSAVSSFQGPVWYYIGQRTERVAFFQPEVTERRVVEIAFDESDRVADVRLYGIEDGQEIALVERETPTEGRDFTVLQQLFGNLGRFNVGDQ